MTTLFRWIAMLLMVFISFGPILVVILSAFKLEKEIFTFVPQLFFKPIIGNFRELITKWPDFFKSLKNSLLITLGTSVLTLLLCIPAAYAYSRLTSKKLTKSALLLIIVRMFPPIITTIPLYPILNKIGMLDTHIVLIMIYTAFQISMSVMIFKTYIDSIPIELEEQAQIDGCSRFKAFRKIMMPLLAPGTVTALIYIILFSWNDFDFAYLMTGTATVTGSVKIAELLGIIGQGAMQWGTIFAASTIQMLPVLIIIWILQRGIIEGYKIGAVKE
jgi:multiple sugar transport system permease protein